MELTYALWITLIGMGLVFAAILVLWGFMALLVTVTTRKEKAEPDLAAQAEPEGGETLPEREPDAITDGAQPIDRKRRAAVAAVAAAFALAGPGKKRGASIVEARPAGGVSQWQAVNRASQIVQIQNVSRKKVAR